MRACVRAGVWNCGQCIALIEDVPTCWHQALVARIIAEAEVAARELQASVVGLTPNRPKL